MADAAPRNGHGHAANEPRPAARTISRRWRFGGWPESRLKKRLR
jgi:hypothetical protein